MAFHENSQPSILLIAGDVSGDVHCARLAQTLLERHPDWSLHALGGSHLKQAISQSPGSHFLADTSGCSAIGMVSASTIYFRCRSLGQRVLDFVQTQPVDAVVLCDWGGFNGRLLPHLRALGIPVLYYFPPRSWQKTGGAGLAIAEFVTRVATPFRWSAARLQAAGCQAEWVGHPALENLCPKTKRRAVRAEFGIEKNEPVVALLPGSRRSEIRILAPTLAKAAALLRAERPMHFVAVVPRSMKHEARAFLPDWIPIITDRAGDALLACDAAMVKTGTATLEAVLADAPQVAVYDASLARGLEWYLLWAWKRIPFIAMPNIILQRMAVPELLGWNCRPRKIARAVLSLLDDENIRDRMLGDYRSIRRALGSELPVPATERTAEIVEEMLVQTKRLIPTPAPVPA